MKTLEPKCTGNYSNKIHDKHARAKSKKYERNDHISVAQT